MKALPPALILLCASALHAQDAGSRDAGAATSVELPEQPLPEAHRPRVSLSVSPERGAAIGDLLKVQVDADSLECDDVTIPEQPFAPFEVSDKRRLVEPAKDGRQRFVFHVDLLLLEAGEHALSPIELRVVTKDGFVGSVATEGRKVTVASLLANEPDAKPRGASQPVRVMQDDYTLLYLLGAIAAATLIALVTWLVSRWWSRRERPEPPPPPPRPPWEIAVEKLAALRRRKQSMLERGQAVQFVDEVSDVVREYLGGRFGFDGLETTTDEMLAQLRHHDANPGLLQEVGGYLPRCDLIKFAKANPDQDEVDLIFAKAQDIVRFSTPERTAPTAQAAVQETGP